MSLYIGVVLFVIDRLIKSLLYNTASVNHGFVAGSVVILIFSTLLILLLTNRFKIDRSMKWDVFIVVGGISNIIDIISFGGVLDYINLFNFKLNFSDILITVGIGLLSFTLWKKKKSI